MLNLGNPSERSLEKRKGAGVLIPTKEEMAVRHVMRAVPREEGCYGWSEPMRLA